MTCQVSRTSQRTACTPTEVCLFYKRCVRRNVSKHTKMIRRIQDSSLSLGKGLRQEQWGKKGRVFLLFLLHVSVWLVFYVRTHIMLMTKTEFLDKRTKPLHLHCASPFWKRFPFHCMSFDPCSLMRPTEQVEFSHSEGTEKTRVLPKTTDRTGLEPSVSNPSANHGKQPPLGSLRKALAILP